MGMNLNSNVRSLVIPALFGNFPERRRTIKHYQEGGAVLADYGIEARGGLSAGVELARVCLAGLGDVSILPGDVAGRPCPHVQVVTDWPILACLASQYAGWQLAEGKFFAMGSGPMRAAYAHELIFSKIEYREKADQVVGVLEGRTFPPPSIFAKIAECCGVKPGYVTLLIAPTASLAGGVQVVARSVETALHKLSELGFDLSRVVSAHGVAPLPPVAADDLAAIGRTNDAILYGARVVLYVTGDDDSLVEIGPKVPSSASRDYGRPFGEVFAAYDHDFYAVDPHLFSPAEVAFQNLDTGRVHVFGQVAPDVMVRSFFG